MEKSDSELVADLLDITPEKARAILANVGGLRGLLNASREELDLTQRQFQRLRGIFEFGNRKAVEELRGGNYARDPEQVVTYLMGALRDLTREAFHVIYLNKANKILANENLFVGTVDETAVHPREIVKAALMKNATGLILAHNHPSGRTQPSPEDREITRRIVSACQTVGIKVLDHVIIGDNQHFSFSEHGLMAI